MALQGLKLTWVCIANLLISCSIILSFKLKNSTFLLFPKHFSFCFYVPSNGCYSKQMSNVFVEQDIIQIILLHGFDVCIMYGYMYA